MPPENIFGCPGLLVANNGTRLLFESFRNARTCGNCLGFTTDADSAERVLKGLKTRRWKSSLRSEGKSSLELRLFSCVGTTLNNFSSLASDIAVVDKSVHDSDGDKGGRGSPDGLKPTPTFIGLFSERDCDCLARREKATRAALVSSATWLFAPCTRGSFSPL